MSFSNTSIVQLLSSLKKSLGHIFPQIPLETTYIFKWHADCIYFSHRGVEDIFLPAKLLPHGIQFMYPLPWNFLGIHCQIPMENGFNRRQSPGFWSLNTSPPGFVRSFSPLPLDFPRPFSHPLPWIFQCPQPPCADNKCNLYYAENDGNFLTFRVRIYFSLILNLITIYSTPIVAKP